MGLASQFGDQGAGYKCKNCGHTVALYTPCCPKCLDSALVKTEKAPEKFKNTVKEESRESTQPGNPVAPFAALAIILALAVAAYNYFSPPPPAITRTEPSPTRSTARPQARSSTRVSNQSKRSKPVVSKTPRSTAASSPTPKPATPMKLWEASSDDE
jgi:hypothetical protein